MGLLKKIIQRGTAPPLDPAAELRLLESVGLGDDIEPVRIPGDLGVRLLRSVPLSDLHAAAQWEAPDFVRDQNVALGSDDERSFVDCFVSTKLGATAARWFIPQPSLDAIAAAAGLPAAGHRRLDFLATPPFHAPFLVEIDGSQHASDPLGDQDRDALVEAAGHEVIRITTADLRAGRGSGLDTIQDRWPVADSPSEAAHRRLAWAPTQVHRVVMALLDAVTVGFVCGDRWSIEIRDPLDIVSELLPPYLDLIAAVDRLWGGAVAPRRVTYGCGDRWYTTTLTGTGYVPPARLPAPSAVDLTIRLESDRSPVDLLDRTTDGPEIVVRSSFLPVDVLDPVYEGGGRIDVRSEGEETEWAVRTVLRSVFAKEDFREGQLDALFEIIEGRDCAVLLPTGAGKSLIYQLAGLILPGRTLVIDPLVALMEDQIEGLLSHGIDRVAAISSYTTMQGQSEGCSSRCLPARPCLCLLHLSVCSNKVSAKRSAQSPRRRRSTWRLLTRRIAFRSGATTSARRISTWAGHCARSAAMYTAPRRLSWRLPAQPPARSCATC